MMFTYTLFKRIQKFCCSKPLMLLIISLFIVAIIITGCTSTSISGRGLKARLVSGYPPNLLYYSPDSSTDFLIQVLVKNTGLSNSLGAVYVTGFDPDIIDVEQSSIPESFTYCTYFNSWRTFLDQGLGVVMVDPNKYALGLMCNKNSGIIITPTEQGWNFDFGNIDDIIGWLGQELGLGGLVGGVEGAFDWLCQNTGVCITGLSGECNLQGEGLHINLAGRTYFDFRKFSCNYLSIDTISKEAEMYGNYLLTMAELEGLTLDRDGFGKVFKVMGDNPNSPGGEEKVVTFDAHVKNFPPNAKAIKQEFDITLLYLYTTYAYKDICVDANPLAGVDEACKPVMRARFKTQKAPVIVESFDYAPGKDMHYYTIHVKNIGSGRVLYWGGLEAGRPGINDLVNFDDYDLVTVANVEVSGRKLVCDNGGLIRLDETGSGTITCSLPVSDWANRPAFFSGISVELWYGYQQKLKAKTNIERIGFTD